MILGYDRVVRFSLPSVDMLDGSARQPTLEEMIRGVQRAPRFITIKARVRTWTNGTYQSWVVIISEIPENPGPPISTAAEGLYAMVTGSQGLLWGQGLWIEHHRETVELPPRPPRAWDRYSIVTVAANYGAMSEDGSHCYGTEIPAPPQWFPVSRGHVASIIGQDPTRPGTKDSRRARRPTGKETGPAPRIGRSPFAYGDG